MLAEAIQSGRLAPGDELPSIAELSSSQGIGTGVIRAALEALAADGLIRVRHGRATVVAAEPGSDPRPVRVPRSPATCGPQRCRCSPAAGSVGACLRSALRLRRLSARRT